MKNNSQFKFYLTWALLLGWIVLLGGCNSSNTSEFVQLFTKAYSWEVSLPTNQFSCYKPNRPLGLNVSVYNMNGALLSIPPNCYSVMSDIPGAIEPFGGDDWVLRGEGPARLTVTYSCDTHPEATVMPVTFDVLRDGTPPQVDIYQPARGAMSIATDDITVLGQATDATSPIQSVTVNGIEQVTATAGLTQDIDVTPPGHWGLNIIEVIATDSCENTVTQTQSYLRSPEYRPDATVPDAAARVARGQSLQMTQTAIDDQDRSDVDDIATLMERYLERNFSNLVAQSTSGAIILSDVAGCPGLGYTLSVAAPGATVTGPRVREIALQSGSIREDLAFDRVTVPLHFVQVTKLGLPITGCTTESIPFDATISANVTSTTTSVETVEADGWISVSLPLVSVSLTDVQLTLTGVSAVDNILSSLLGLLTSYVETILEGEIREQVPPLIEEALNTPLTASQTIAGGPFKVTLGVFAGIDGFAVNPNAATQTAYTQIYPVSVGTPYPALGAIERPTAPANLAANPGPITYAIDDNLANQGLWALWQDGGMEIPDVIGFPGTTLRISALLPPVVMPGTQPDEISFGIGDLNVALSLDLIPDMIPPVTGHVEVEAYVSYILDGKLEYDGATRDFHLRSAPENRTVYVQIKRLSDGINDITNPEFRAQIEAYTEQLLTRWIEQFADETLVSLLLPPLRFQFTEPVAGGTVDAIEMEVTALSRSADHFIIDMMLKAEEPTNSQLDGYLTLNNPWTRQDLIDQNIPIRFWDNTPTMEDPVASAIPSKSITVFDYQRTTRPECDAAGNSPAGDPICLPQWKFPLDYGYYCGAGRPVVGWTENPILDPVDYCCRLHDRNLFDPQGGATSPHNACGFVMCVSQATGFPADITSRMPDVERARRQMYNKASILCGPNIQPELAPPEIVAP